MSSLIGNFAAPKEYDREHQSQFVGAVQRELDGSYRKNADVIIPLGKALGFTSPQGIEYRFSVDADGAFTFGVNGETATSLASIDYVSGVIVDASEAFAGEATEIRAEFAAGDAAVSATVTNEATARANGDISLASQITALQASYIAADAVVSASVLSEASARASADGGLATSISVVTASYQAADAVLTASVSTNATAIADVSGRLAASYTVELDVNGRITLMRLQDDGTTRAVIFKSDTFQFYDGITDVALFSAGGGIVTINGDLAVTGAITVGAVRWPISLQPKVFLKADGEALEWASGSALNEVPDVQITVPAGVALAAGEAWEPPSISSATTIGGTLRLKIATPGATAGVTDSTDAAGGGGNPDRVMAKSDSADAYNGVYSFRVAGSLHVTSYYSADAGGYVNEGTIEISPWFDDGGGFDEGAWFSVNPWDAGIDGVTGSSVTGDYAYDLTVPVTWTNAIGAGGTYAFGVSKESGHVSSTLTDLTSVYYLKQTVSGSRTGSPNGETATISVIPKNQ